MSPHAGKRRRAGGRAADAAAGYRAGAAVRADRSPRLRDHETDGLHGGRFCGQLRGRRGADRLLHLAHQLARISQQVTAARARWRAMTALRLIRVLDVLTSTPPRPNRRAPSRVLKNSRGCRAWVLWGRGKERGGWRCLLYRRRRETRHMPHNPHAPGGLRAAWGHLRRWPSSTICEISPASGRLASAPTVPVTAPPGVLQHPADLTRPRARSLRDPLRYPG